MAVTNYIAIGEMQIGERIIGGIRMNYGVDALGSVTSTLSAGAIGNRYIYKPYGSLLSRSGGDPDPIFSWVGTQGYRSNIQQHAEFYVRARTFSPKLTRWLSVDPLFAFGIPTGKGLYQPPLCYASNPASITDPSGLDPCPSPGAGFFYYVPDKPTCPPNTPFPKFDYPYALFPCGKLNVYDALAEDEWGETNCVYGTGEPFYHLCDSTCYCKCTVAHEETHVNEIRGCCLKTKTLYNDARDWIIKNGNKPNSILLDIHLEFLRQYSGKNKSLFECHAYRSELACADLLLSTTKDPKCATIVRIQRSRAERELARYCQGAGAATPCPDLKYLLKTHNIPIVVTEIS